MYMNDIVLCNVDYILEPEMSKIVFNINWFENISIFCGYDSLSDVKNDPRKKIVMLGWWQYQTPNKIDDLSWADLVICFTTEVIHEPWEEFYSYTKSYFKNQNIIFILGGDRKEDFIPSDLCLSQNLSFLFRVASANTPVEYDTTNNRPYMFDALFGQKKEHRVKIFERMKSLDLLDSSIINLENGIYFSNDSIPDYRSPILDTLEDPDILEFRNANIGNLKKMYFANAVNRRYKNLNAKVWASQVIPHEVYKNSWYSIVAETNSCIFNFITEKTGKCFYGKRVFLCFAAQGHLKLLQKHGFKTFNGIIDESYDDEPDPDKRLELFVEQIKFLSKSNPVKIYEQAKPILDHNFNLINDMSWQMHKIKNFIQPHLEKLK